VSTIESISSVFELKILFTAIIFLPLQQKILALVTTFLYFVSKNCFFVLISDGFDIGNDFHTILEHRLEIFLTGYRIEEFGHDNIF